MLFGIAQHDITPAPGTELGGYGFYRNRRATHVNDALTADALVITGDNGETAALCSAHVFSLEAATVAAIGKEVSRRTRGALTETNLLLFATHTHTGPAVSSVTPIGIADHDYIHTILVPQIAAAIAEAYVRKVPGELGSRSVPVLGASRNRCNLPTNDTTLDILRARDCFNREIAVLGFGAHPTALGCQPYISRDFPGAALDALCADLPIRRALWITGSCGDINPPNDAGINKPADYAEAAQIGTTIAKAARAAYEHIPLRRGNVTLQRRTVFLPIEPQFTYSKAGVEKSIKERYSLSELPPPMRKTVDFVDEQMQGPLASEVPVTLSIAQLGTTTLIGVDAETHSTFGLALRERLPDRNLLIANLCNGHRGYIGNALDRRGYTMMTAPSFGRGPFAPEAEELLINAVTASLQK